MVIFWALAVSLSETSFSNQSTVYMEQENMQYHQDHPLVFQPRPLHLRLHLNL